jgi:hypothetical protein
MINLPNVSTHSSSARENSAGYSTAQSIKRRNSREIPIAFYEIPS